MELFKWSSSLSIGIDSIDQQHRKLVDLINQLHTAMLEKRTTEVMGAILNQLIDYTKSHFLHEENLFKIYKYAAADVHVKEHADLSAKVLELQREFRSGKVGMGLETFTFLKNWLTEHIQKTDKKYASFLIEKGIK